ncbi:hypothetical protein SDC9_92642 [bioreactor metagenome]|uniref:VanZ-like domain-containing protein n=1 Tax=bioreactor metagenome TaxID=1076179 RepID=A0A644ZZR7_9ZZZZ
MPLGFLLALALLRTGWTRAAVPVAFVAGTLLSLSMEFTQIYLPRRVPSNMDLLLNSAGTLVGALLAALLEKLGAISRWSRFRERWFVPHARGALVLLAVWPLALLFPASVPFGLGQTWERTEMALTEWFSDTPFIEWLPVLDDALEPLSPGGELMAVMLGILIPCLLGYCVIRSPGRRAIFTLVTAVVGVSVTALTFLLSYGPAHAWEWQSVPTRIGLGLGMTVALALAALPRRACAALLLLALMVHLNLLNQAPASAYFAQTLRAWEQGRFIRFYGVAQWLGWIWPYAALVYVVTRVSRRSEEA